MSARLAQIEIDSPATASGLSEAEAAARLRRDGYNELPAHGRRSIVRILVDVLREPMFALLLGAAAVYLAIGNLKEAIVLVLFATTSVSIALIQENPHRARP
jgi:Ca2+-transporting ATPase